MVEVEVVVAFVEIPTTRVESSRVESFRTPQCYESTKQVSFSSLSCALGKLMDARENVLAAHNNTAQRLSYYFLSFHRWKP